MYIFKLLTIIFSFIFFFIPNVSQAARLYMDPAEGIYGPGDDVMVDIKIDVLDACINTVEAEIVFPEEQLYIQDFIIGESIISIWLEKPSTTDFDEINKNGILKFSGGIPGGYCGKIPGDPGESNILGKLIFTVPSMVVSEEKKSELDILFTANTKVLKNDGFGTEEETLKQSASFKIANQRQNEQFDWKEVIESDKIPPEPFVIELRQSETMFGGAYHLIFTTVDKQTGLDHFEVLEIKANEQIGVKPTTNFWEKFFEEEKEAPNWTYAAMPYKLKDQTLSSIIKVKAVDKAGNERIVEYIPPMSETTQKEFSFNVSLVVLIFILVVVFVFIIIFILFKKRRKRIDENNFKI